MELFFRMKNVSHTGRCDSGQRSKDGDVFDVRVEDMFLFNGEVKDGQANTSDASC